MALTHGSRTQITAEMRFVQFRVAAYALVVAVACATATSSTHSDSRELIGFALAAALLASFLATAVFARQAFAWLQIRPFYSLVWAVALCLARLTFEMPNTFYVPLIVFAFLVSALGEIRTVLWTTGFIVASGAVTVYYALIGSIDPEFEKLAFTYAFSPATATLLIGFVVTGFQRSLDEIEQIATSGSSDPAVSDAASEQPGQFQSVNGSRISTSMDVTEGQARVLDLLVEGISNDEIARRLEISPRTVQSHIRGAMSRTGLSTRTQLAVAVALTLDADGS